ncbi:zinc chelation protein SecC [Chitinilyticum litopenaei]|uniref:Zinc chelation protein SecC n=2 Tax=Chitinilyticum piscinae TaxID=2866724 RepID=A0A8J7G1R6_9NEIS|nr:zinc chelation protein SecC [Chitinilyticum piscinae]
MRSRYSAYVLELESYLLATWHASTRPEALALGEEPRPKWLGLAVKLAETDGERGVVAFVARYKVGGRAYRMEEHSRFVREDGRWFYVDGDVSD